MGNAVTCRSCGMSIESGPYCRYCQGEGGGLIPFEECFERMVQWSRRRNPDQSKEEAERATRAYMATMPAWRDHPRLSENAGG